MTLVTTAPAAIALGVGKSFGDRTVLHDLDVTVARGEFVALLGASGSGKTTLLRILAGLEAASAGEVLVPEVRTVVYQEPRLVASMRVWRNVVLGLPRAAATRAAAARRARRGRPRGPGRRLARHPLGRRGPAGRPGPGPRARAASSSCSTSPSPPSTR